jgi:hypothetical protein
MSDLYSSGRLWRGLWLAGLVFAFAASGSLQAATIADSFDDWSTTGTQGENDWYNGWRNFTLDGGGDYDYLADFIPFLNDGSNVVSQDGPNQWTGSNWDLNSAASGPWTFLAAQDAHPNGTNSAPNQEHWVIRRWVAASVTAPTQLELTSRLWATNTSGPGTTVHLFQNGTLLDTLTTNTGVGLINSIYPIISPGDVIDLALTPEGIDGDRTDGSDGSAFRLTITDNVPPIPPLADSADDWSTTGTQGEKNWFSGYYNKTQDPDSTYQPTDFIAFANLAGPGGGTVAPDGNHWTGTQWDLTPSGAPWTFMGQTGTHPNGINSAPNDEHWSVRRWVASDLTEKTRLALNWQMAKTNVGGGDGVAGKLFVNGLEYDSASITGTDGIGVNRTYYLDVNPGDIIDLALAPNAADGSDGSLTRLTVRANLPDGPLYNPTVPVNIVANSKAEFSGNQGQDGWTYGYYDVRDDVENGNGQYDPSDLIPFLNDGSGVIGTDGTVGAWKSSPNHWNGSKWDLLDNNAAQAGPWTEVTNTGGHPAAGGTSTPDVHWAVRRWVSDFDGDVRISGVLNNISASGDGTVGRIFLDGAEVWSQKSNGDSIIFAVDLLDVSSGSVFDFAIDPDGAGVLNPLDPLTLASINDGSDGTNFWFTIEEIVPIPEPSSVLLAGLGLLGLAALRRRR